MSMEDQGFGDEEENDLLDLTGQRHVARTNLRTLMALLDRLHHTEFAKHLYSSVIMRDPEHTRLNWGFWPLADAPIPRGLPQFGEDDPHKEPAARQNLVEAMTAILQKEVYKRIREDGLEPVADPEPSLGGMTDILVDRMESIFDMVAAPSYRVPHIRLKSLPVEPGPALDRMNRLFGKDLDKIREEYGIQTHEENDDESQDGSDDEEE